MERKKYTVVERLPDGRERKLGTFQTPAAAKLALRVRAKWAGFIRQVRV
jgi:hypothetical protein